MLAIVPEASLKNPQPLRSRLRGTTDAARVERRLNLPVNLWVERGLNLPVNLWVERDNLAVSTDASSRVGVSALSTSESTTPGFRTPNLASSQDGIRVLARIGVALGFIVAPFQAFHRMRIERDEARSGNVRRARVSPFAGNCDRAGGGRLCESANQRISEGPDTSAPKERTGQEQANPRRSRDLKGAHDSGRALWSAARACSTATDGWFPSSSGLSLT